MHLLPHEVSQLLVFVLARWRVVHTTAAFLVHWVPKLFTEPKKRQNRFASR